MYVIGIDIGGMTIKTGLMDGDGNILTKEVCQTKPERHYSFLIADMFSLCEKVCENAKISLNQVVGIGIGCPGSVDSKKGVITYAGNLNFRNVNIIKEFQKFTKIPTVVGNDANCASLGEARFGSGKGARNAILITLGTGVGTGFIIDGKMLEGSVGIGAEGGHICIKQGGEKCSCGERGCWEAYASATALKRITQKAIDKYPNTIMRELVKEEGQVSGKTAFIAYKQGDKIGAKVVAEYVANIATGLTILVNIFRPEIIMIGGGVSKEGKYFIDMIAKRVKRHSFGGSKNKVCPIVQATLGNDAGIVGAGVLARENNG